MEHASTVTRKPRLVRFTDDLAPGRNLHYAGAPTPHCPGAPAPSLLLVDDEACIRELMAVMFRREGYLTTVAAHGLAALRILEQQRIDLLVTEVNMPILDGPRLAHCARAIIPDLPVLFLSGSANAAGWVPKHPHAKTAIVYKPFSLLNLLNTVEQLLEDRVAAGPRKGHAG